MSVIPLSQYIKFVKMVDHWYQGATIFYQVSYTFLIFKGVFFKRTLAIFTMKQISAKWWTSVKTMYCYKSSNNVLQRKVEPVWCIGCYVSYEMSTVWRHSVGNRCLSFRSFTGHGQNLLSSDTVYIATTPSIWQDTIWAHSSQEQDVVGACPLTNQLTLWRQAHSY